MLRQWPDRPVCKHRWALCPNQNPAPSQVNLFFPRLLGLYLNGRSVYGCTLMPLLPMPSISPMDPERIDCHDPQKRF